jgi:hypothetical protein
LSFQISWWSDTADQNRYNVRIFVHLGEVAGEARKVEDSACGDAGEGVLFLNHDKLNIT